jgi:acetolactate decarboxylase
MGLLWQNAPAIALESGCFQGITPVSELEKRGDFGVGAYHDLDGEMVGVDGVFYRVSADSRPHVPPEDDSLAFCMVCRFSPERRAHVEPGTSQEGLTAKIDELLGPPNVFAAIRFDGALDGLRTRCLPRQDPPYPPLSEAAANQPEYAYERIEGTIVGFRAPPYVGRLAPPGDHLHFISADRSVGGHVLGFRSLEGELALERHERHEVGYPIEGSFAELRLD